MMRGMPQSRLRSARLLAAALPALAGLALVPAAAEARTSRALVVTTPSKLVTCYALTFAAGGGIECQAPYLRAPATGEGDATLQLHPRGRSRSIRRGDFPGYSTKRRPTLDYGTRWLPARGGRGVLCRSRSTGLTCSNRSGHGFRLTKGDVRRF